MGGSSHEQDAKRLTVVTGTLEDPIVVNSAGNEQYVGCTGCPADSHEVLWITVGPPVHRSQSAPDKLTIPS
jgi:hypothetical protein